jgi:hypothetical protein
MGIINFKQNIDFWPAFSQLIYTLIQRLTVKGFSS